MKHFYLYRLHVVAYPEGSHRPHAWLGEEWPVPVESWAPPNWSPDDEYLQQFKTSRFIWPKVDRVYRSQSSAKSRAKLLQFYGATVLVERSSRITWPDPEDVAS